MPHPNLPVLATSGLDDDVKIWLPTAKEEEDEETSASNRKEIERVVTKNLQEQENGPESDDDFSGEMMVQAILRQMQRPGARRIRRVSVDSCHVRAFGLFPFFKDDLLKPRSRVFALKCQFRPGFQAIFSGGRFNPDLESDDSDEDGDEDDGPGAGVDGSNIGCPTS